MLGKNNRVPIGSNLTQREHDDSFTYTAPEQLPSTAHDHHRGRVGDNIQKQETWGSGDVPLPIQSSYSCDPGVTAHFFFQDPDCMAICDLSGVATHRALVIPRDGRFPAVPFV